MIQTEAWGILLGENHLCCQVYYTEHLAQMACTNSPGARPVRVKVEMVEVPMIREKPSLRLVKSDEAAL